jgi:hypothetical protein
MDGLLTGRDPDNVFGQQFEIALHVARVHGRSPEVPPARDAHEIVGPDVFDARLPA